MAHLVLRGYFKDILVQKDHQSVTGLKITKHLLITETKNQAPLLHY